MPRGVPRNPRSARRPFRNNGARAFEQQRERRSGVFLRFQKLLCRCPSRKICACGKKPRHLSRMRRQQTWPRRPAQCLRIFGQQIERICVHDHRSFEILSNRENVRSIHPPKPRPDGQHIQSAIQHREITIQRRHHHLGHRCRGHNRVNVRRHKQRYQSRACTNRRVRRHDRRAGKPARTGHDPDPPALALVRAETARGQ